MSKATIVIPCFNAGVYLAEAIESAKHQTYQPKDIIVIDDGSTESETIAILDRYRQLDLRIFRTPNRGVSAARNYGIGLVNTPYVVCLDADDVILPTYLEDTVPVLDADHEAGVVTTHVDFFGEVNGIWKTPEYDPVRLMWENC